MSGAVEEFHARGRTAVLAGEEIYDQPPSTSSPRWGVSVILRPDVAAAERLATATSELAAVAGDAHWPTGRRGSGHVTVRVLEPYRDPVPQDDPAIGRYTAAVSRTAARAAPLTLSMAGLVLMPGGVLAVAEPVDAAPEELRAVLAAELGADSGYEHDGYRRNLWWSTLLHFAGPLADRAALVHWVEERRTLDLGLFHARSLDLVRYEYNGAHTAPVALTSLPLES